MTTQRNDAGNETADLGKSAALEAGGRPSSPVNSSLPLLPYEGNPIIEALKLLARHGRAIREAGGGDGDGSPRSAAAARIIAAASGVTG